MSIYAFSLSKIFGKKIVNLRKYVSYGGYRGLVDLFVWVTFSEHSVKEMVMSSEHTLTTGREQPDSGITMPQNAQLS